MTNEELHDKERRSSTEIESDIRQTRGRMDTTLDELGDRLTARSLLNSALDWWESRSVGARTGGATKDTYQTVARYVKENPIPALLVGAGVAWMIIEATTSDEEETRFYTEPASHKGKRSDSATRYYPSEYQGDDQTELAGRKRLRGLLRARKTNWNTQRKQLPELQERPKRKCLLWAMQRPKLLRTSADAHRKCMKKAGRPRAKSAVASRADTTRAQSSWKTRWRSILWQ